MPTPDYEDDLAFEPRETEDLTRLWKHKKLDTTQRYWVIEDGFSKPIPRLMNENGEFIDGTGYPIHRRKIKAVLNICDYDELESLEDDKIKLTEYGIKQELRIASLFSKNSNLRNLLKECKEYLSDVEEFRTKNADEAYLLITRINAVLSESERK